MDRWLETPKIVMSPFQAGGGARVSLRTHDGICMSAPNQQQIPSLFARFGGQRMDPKDR